METNETKYSETSEKSIERYLIKRVKELGGFCLKYYNPGCAGYPDRICFMPWGRTILVELKSTGEKPTPQQRYRFMQLDSIGHVVHVADSKYRVDEILRDHGYEV